ncbi:uncharacterized protein LOC118767031 [Octopus sinensis]|uniref:Uncharacterized protein LOC118767031 n=1 Tax=Octopus sinensis TaxID=2607531 RepID=A0A7E6FGJ4_9MOLL|nr:uncharacterized protein LOC118767031 [Octopus sinensis]
MMTENCQLQEVRLISSFITDANDFSNQSIELVAGSNKSIYRKKPAIIPRKHLRDQVKDGSITVERLQTSSENQCTTNSGSVYLLNLETQKPLIFKPSDQNSCSDSKRNTSEISNKLLISHEVKICPYETSSYCLSKSSKPLNHERCKEQLLLLSPPSQPPPLYDGLDFHEENLEHDANASLCDGNYKGVVSPLKLSSNPKDSVIDKDMIGDLIELYNKPDSVKDNNTCYQVGGNDKKDVVENNKHIRSNGYNKFDAPQNNAHVQSNGFNKRDVPKNKMHALSEEYDKRRISPSNTHLPYNGYCQSRLSPDGSYRLNEGIERNLPSDTIHALYEDYHENIISNDNSYDDFIKNLSPGNHSDDYYEVLPNTIYIDDHKKVLSSDYTQSLSEDYYKSTCTENEEYYKRHDLIEDIGSRDYTRTVYDSYNNYSSNVVSPDNSYSLNDNCPGHAVSSNKNQRYSVDEYKTIISSDDGRSFCSDTRPFVKKRSYSNSNQNYISPDTVQNRYTDSQRNMASSVGSPTSNVELQENVTSLIDSQDFPVDYTEDSGLQNERIFTRSPKPFPLDISSKYSPIEKDEKVSSSFIDHSERTNVVFNPLNGRESKHSLPIQIKTTQECSENFPNVYRIDSDNQRNNNDNTKMRYVKPPKFLSRGKSHMNGEETVVVNEDYQNMISPVFAGQFNFDDGEIQQSVNSVNEIFTLPYKISENYLQDDSLDGHMNPLLASSPLSPRFPRHEMSDRFNRVKSNVQKENNPLKQEGTVVDDVFYLDSPDNRTSSRALPSRSSFCTFSENPSHDYDKRKSKQEHQQTKRATSWSSNGDLHDVSDNLFQNNRTKPNYFYFSQQQSPLHYEDIEESFPFSAGSPKVNSDYYYTLDPLAASTSEGMLKYSEKYKENTNKQYSRRHSSLVTDESGFVDGSNFSAASGSADYHQNIEKISMLSFSNSEEYEFNNVEVFPAYVDNYENYVNSPGINVSVDPRKKTKRVSFSCSKETGFENYANIDDFNDISRTSNDDSFTREKAFSYLSVRSPRSFTGNTNCERIPRKKENNSKADLYMNSEEAANYINSLSINSSRASDESECNLSAKENAMEISAVDRGFRKLSEALENTLRKPPSKITFASDRMKKKFFTEKIQCVK